MGCGVHPSTPPPAVGPGIVSAKPARGGESPRGLSPRRKTARDRWADAFDLACRATNTTNAAISQALDNVGDKLGSEARSGKAAVTAGEAADLLPLEAAAIADAELWTERYAREAALTDDPLRQQLLELLLSRRAEERKLLTALAHTKTRTRAA